MCIDFRKFKMWHLINFHYYFINLICMSCCWKNLEQSLWKIQFVFSGASSSSSLSSCSSSSSSLSSSSSSGDIGYLSGNQISQRANKIKATLAAVPVATNDLQRQQQHQHRQEQQQQPVPIIQLQEETQDTQEGKVLSYKRTTLFLL